MKILIVTYYFVNSNYGAIYQAYALGEYLRLQSHDVSYWGKKELEDYSPSDSYSIKKKEAIKKSRSSWKVDYALSSLYDIAIIGSDQVWGGFEPWFWGVGLPAKKIVAYAPSVGNLLTSNNRWKALIKPYIGTLKFFMQASKIKKFDMVCARDSETQRLVKKILKRDVPIVLDPTFLIDWTAYLKHVEISEPYVLVYSYGLSQEIEDYVNTYAKEKGLKVVTVNYYTDKSDYCEAYSPKEVLGLYANAKMVFTDSFHGTVFSVIFKRQFMVIKKGKKTKPYMFLNQIDGNNRYVESVEAAKAVIDQPVDYARIEKKIKHYLEISKKYLQKVTN